jgi:hypothetical protein
MRLKQKLIDWLAEEFQDAAGDSDGELLSVEEVDLAWLEGQAAAAAAEHSLSDGAGRGWLLLPRFIKNLRSQLWTGRSSSPASARLTSY